MLVSIIIVNYKTPQLVLQCIDSIRKKTKGINYEIIIVDNDSQDDSVQLIENYLRENENIIASTENLGFGKANNLGIMQSKGEYIFLLNSDTILINNAIFLMKEYMERNPDVGICGANLYDNELNPNHSFMPTIISYKDEFNFIFHRLYKFLRKQRIDFNFTEMPKEVGYVTGAAMMIRKECLNLVGNFDPDFFMYYEETELTYRISNKGYKVISLPTAKIIHLEGKSFEFKEQRFSMILESKYKYFEKVYSKKMSTIVYYISQLKYILIPTPQNIIKFKINKRQFKSWKERWN